MASVNGPTTFASAPTGSSAPDSITMENDSFFVEYGNGADSTGAGGSSTIVQYDKAGNIEHSYSIAGSVDGLKYNPYIKEIWALQNQDGNSTLNAFGQVDVGTGVFTALVSAQNAPGFTFGSPHGVAFVPDKNAAPSPQITAIKTFQAPTDGRPSGSACFHNAGPFGGIMAWVAWQASAWQGPTCCSVPAGCSPYRARRSRRFRSACRWPAG